MAHMHVCIHAAAITLYGTHACMHLHSSNHTVWHMCMHVFMQQQSHCMAHMHVCTHAAAISCMAHIGNTCEHTRADRYQSIFADIGYFSMCQSEVWTMDTACSSLMMMGNDLLINDGLANSDFLGHYSCSSKCSVTSLKTRRLSR